LPAPLGGEPGTSSSQKNQLQVRTGSKTVVLLTIQGSPPDTFKNHSQLAAELQTVAVYVPCANTPFSRNAFYVKLLAMGNKDKGRKETKKAPKPKPKPEPSRREIFTPAAPAK
jgi:hypothetical protein